MINETEIEKEGIEFHKNFDLSKYCTWKSGCKAKYLFYPKNSEELKKIINFKTKFYVVGNGSNTLFINLKDTILISTKKMNQIYFDGEFLIAESGASLSMVMNKCLDRDLLGFEFSTGIPGTIGGALITNAGANGGEISDNLVSIFLLRKNKEVEVERNKINFSYRSSSIKRTDVITKAKFRLKKGSSKEARIKINEYLKYRNDTQPVKWPSAGSVFKNPLPKYAGKIIEELGLKGTRLGNAEVSKIHSNYIINKNNASPEEIKDLIETIREKVLKETGIILENEVRIIND